MQNPIHIVGLGGSLSPRSSSLAALKVALAGPPKPVPRPNCSTSADSTCRFTSLVCATAPTPWIGSAARSTRPMDSCGAAPCTTGR